MHYLVRTGYDYVTAYKKGYMPYITSDKEEAKLFDLDTAKEICAYMKERNFSAVIEKTKIGRCNNG